MKGYVYILRDEDGRFYVGSTKSVENRMKLHRSGTTRTTKGMKNPQIVLVQEYYSIILTRKVERRMKALKSKKYIDKMVSDGYIRITPS